MVRKRLVVVVGLFAAGLIAAFVQAQGQVPQQVANPAAVINGTGTATRAAARPRGGNRYTTRSAPATRPANPSDLTPPRPFNPAQGVAELPSVLKVLRPRHFRPASRTRSATRSRLKSPSARARRLSEHPESRILIRHLQPLLTRT